MEVILKILGAIGSTIENCVNFIKGIIDFVLTYINLLPNDFKLIIVVVLTFGIAVLVYRFIR